MKLSITDKALIEKIESSHNINLERRGHSLYAKVISFRHTLKQFKGEIQLYRKNDDTPAGCVWPFTCWVDKTLRMKLKSKAFVNTKEKI